MVKTFHILFSIIFVVTLNSSCSDLRTWVMGRPDAKDGSVVEVPAPEVEPTPDVVPVPEKEPEVVPAVNVAPTAKSKLVYSTVATWAFPWKSEIHAMDVETQSDKRLLQGESSDPALFVQGDQVVLCGRSFENKSLRFLTLDEASEDVNVGTQQAYRAGDLGDPHGMAVMADGARVLANYSAGNLLLADTKLKSFTDVFSKSSIQTDVKMNLESIELVGGSDAATDRMIAVHQGMSVQEGKLVPDGTQMAIALQRAVGASEVEVLGTAALDGSFPVLLTNGNKAERVVSVSLCSRGLAASDPQNYPCRSGVESIQWRDGAVIRETLWDLGTEPEIFMNGSIVAGWLDGTAYASVEVGREAAAAIRKVVMIDWKNKKVTPVYEYDEVSGGFFALIVDQRTRRLYIGDQNGVSAGRFVVFDADGNRSEIATSGVPYSGVVMQYSVMQP
jgi:hypothetical protein